MTRLYGLDAGVASRGQAIDARWISIGGRFAGSSSVVSYTDAQGDLVALQTDGTSIAVRVFDPVTVRAFYLVVPDCVLGAAHAIADCYASCR